MRACAAQPRDFRPSAAIYDLDGTLLDIEPLYYDAFVDATRQINPNYEHTPKLHTDLLLGRQEKEGAARLLAHLAVTHVTPEELLSMRDSVLIRGMKDVKPMPGAFQLVSAARASGLRTAIATSSMRSHLEHKRESNEELFGCVDAIICGDDDGVRGRGKPNPAIFLAAASALGVSPSTCIAFEDSLAGITAAVAAGMVVVAVPDPRLTEADVVALHPHWIVRSLLDVDWTLLGLDRRVS